MARIDPHSYFDDAQPRLARFELQLTADFTARTLAGQVCLALDEPGEGPLDLDSRGLTIHRAVNQEGLAVPFECGEEDPILGRRLRLALPPGTRLLTLDYQTSPGAVALQWLDPAQTAGGRHPFLFSQCQAIHARTMVPLQDSPRVRVRYGAAITVPAALTAVMSAGTVGVEPGKTPGTRTFRFEMPQPIPSYLLALAVGRLEGRDLGPRSRVYAEPETVERAAFEFAQIEESIGRAEKLFGPYEWDRFDMLVLPPSFPYGGMENPRLTFLTPTLLAGDRSLVDVVVHELAHSWTGNLVTNATMDHFWLNEGFTVWAERRILEELHGPEAACLAWAIGQRGMEEAFGRFGMDSSLTRLRADLAGVDPDDAYSLIPYEKGARFVVLLERQVGRERFEQFVRRYIARFRFTSITTEEFLEFLEQELPGVAGQVDARAWLYDTGLPPNAPAFRSARLEELMALAQGWAAGRRPDPAALASFKPQEILIYLQQLPREIGREGLEWLDRTFGLGSQGNYEILVEWLSLAAGNDHEPAFPKVREVLATVGRMKYLRPLYTALGKHPRTRALAGEIFTAARDKYHALSRRVIEGVLEKYPA